MLAKPLSMISSKDTTKIITSSASTVPSQKTPSAKLSSTPSPNPSAAPYPKRPPSPRHPLATCHRSTKASTKTVSATSIRAIPSNSATAAKPYSNDRHSCAIQMKQNLLKNQTKNTSPTFHNVSIAISSSAIHPTPIIARVNLIHLIHVHSMATRIRACDIASSLLATTTSNATPSTPTMPNSTTN